MGFGNIALLFGMLVGLIPIIIHLINRQRARLRRFAAIDFLLLSDKRIARRLKLKQLLILALRVLLLMLLAFALAKPYLTDDAQVATGSSDPAGVALIIDDSMSMHATVDGERLLDSALTRARAIVDQGGKRTSFAVIAAGAPARLLTNGLTYDHAAIERALQRIDDQPRGTDMTGALREAGRVLSESPEARRLVYLLSDQAAHAWDDVALSWDFVPVTEVVRVDPREGRPVDNAAVTAVAVARVDGGADGPDLQVEATVVNHGLVAREVPVELSLGDKIVAERATIAPGARATVRFALKTPQGASRGVVRFAEADALPDDDQWYFTIEQGQRVNVLVVNGAPRSVAYQDELFFLRAALRARLAGDVAISAVYTTNTELTPAQIGPMDVVVLANVGTLTAEQSLALKNFVEAGGGLLVAGGDNFDDTASNRTYGQLLPYPIRGTKIVARADDPGAVLSALTLSGVDFGHPIMQVFDGVDDASLFKAHVFGYVLLDTTPRDGAKVIASYAGGIPAIVEAPLGRGRVIALTTTVDRDWADLAIRSSFVPLMQRTIQYLGRALGADAGEGFVVGRNLEVPLPEGDGPLTLTRPDGAQTQLDPDADDQLTGSVFIEAPELAGHYTLARVGDARRAVGFAVNAERRDSDLAPAAPETLARIVAELQRDNGILPDAPPTEDVLTAGTSGNRTILWPYMLAGLFILFAAEAWLIVRGG